MADLFYLLPLFCLGQCRLVCQCFESLVDGQPVDRHSSLSFVSFTKFTFQHLNAAIDNGILTGFFFFGRDYSHIPTSVVAEQSGKRGSEKRRAVSGTKKERQDAFEKAFLPRIPTIWTISLRGLSFLWDKCPKESEHVKPIRSSTKAEVSEAHSEAENDNFY